MVKEFRRHYCLDFVESWNTNNNNNNNNNAASTINP